MRPLFTPWMLAAVSALAALAVAPSTSSGGDAAAPGPTRVTSPDAAPRSRAIQPGAMSEPRKSDARVFEDPAYPWNLSRGEDAPPYAPDFESAQSALNRLERAYRNLDLATYASLLTADYSFHSEDLRIDARYHEGLDRAFDLRSTAGLFNVAHVPNKPPIRSIDFDLGRVSEGMDVAHADSTDQYRLLIVPNPQMTVYAEGGDQMILTHSLLAFYMVRGDAAVLPAGAPADAGHWYLREWVETPPDEATRAAQAGTPPAADLRLAKNPASGAFEVVLTVPQSGLYRIEVFDVAGRSIRKGPARSLQVGTTRLELQQTRHLPAGIYWVQLQKDGRALATRVATRL